MYTPETVRRLSVNPVAEHQILRVVSAMNGLTSEFGQTWVEKHLYGFVPAERSRECGISVDILTHQTANFDHLVFLWEDIEILRGLNGFGDLQKKLNVDLRSENVDLEISVAADFCRLITEVQLEPSVGKGNHKSDLKFKVRPDGDWTYAEVTRKKAGKVGELLKERGEKLAALVAARDPLRRNFIAITRSMDSDFSDQEFAELVAWIPGSDPDSQFKDYGFVGSIPHGEDEMPLVLPHFPGPVSCVSSSDAKTLSFGIAYLYVPDFGAENKFKDKRVQAKQGSESLLFIDLTQTHGTQAQWDDRIEMMECAGNFSAVVLLRSEHDRKGFTRKCTIVEPKAAERKLSGETRLLLSRFADLRVQWSLGEMK
jgi:hypothetical protein